ncbi:MAG: LptF/LptG family permease [Cyclonatronaceae bacterium]
MKFIDLYILKRLAVITGMVLALLIFIFVIIDFSENSDSFTDRGATMEAIWNDYYLHYIPEMIRLVTPVAVFVACLLVTGQMAERLEIIALKAAGISLYRLTVPYLFFAGFCFAVVAYLDGYIVPKSTTQRIEFEREYLMKRSDRIDRNVVYRQESDSTLIVVNYFDGRELVGYQATMYQIKQNRITKTVSASRLNWNNEAGIWTLHNGEERTFNNHSYETVSFETRDTTLNLLPRDFARTTSDVYQLTYPEVAEYIRSLQRSGAEGIAMPLVQFYTRLAYPFSIIVITIIGLTVASERRKGGKGVYLGIGLVITVLYLGFMKLLEPFGYTGTIDPVTTAVLPHLVFALVGFILLVRAKK